MQSLGLHARLFQDVVNEYYFPHHVRFIIDGEAVVFMNVRADRYSMLLGPKAKRFVSLLSYRSETPKGLITVEKEGELGPGSEADIELVAELLENDLLSREEDLDPGEVAREIPLPEAALAAHPNSERQTITPLAVVRFFASCGIAIWRLRCSSIERTISVIERRKANRSGDLVVLGEAQKLVATFMKLRPLFPRGFLCLFDSLALLEFLAMHSCYPNLIFAVKAQPWYAHCWVQYGCVAFNQDLDDMRDYVPLMSV